MRSIAFIGKAAPWVLAALIVFWTLGPLGDRPSLGHAKLDRFVAYFCLGSLLTLAYPKRRLWIALALVAGPAILELGQFLAPGRDPRLSDVVSKAAGGLIGVWVAAIAARLARGLAPSAGPGLPS
ncbi:MAG TPA: hypothetical protein VMU59_08625 [Caulobacteraceae bacterium]|nr:hypothetical protein [Caulobacteraceae bacterium]